MDVLGANRFAVQGKKRKEKNCRFFGVTCLGCNEKLN